MNQGKIVTQIGVLRRIDGPIPYWVWQATAEVASGGSLSHVIIPFADDRVRSMATFIRATRHSLRFCTAPWNRWKT